MAYRERRDIYTRLCDRRKRPLLVYFTSSRANAGGLVAGDAVDIFAAQLLKIDRSVQHLDLLINSNGGDGVTSWRIITMIREYLGPESKITCLVPFFAFSAATLMAVGCDEIYMHPFASLGPVDPQISIQTEKGVEHFAYEDVPAYTKFIKEEAGIDEQQGRASLIGQLVNQIKPSLIGASKRASLQSVIMAERLLKLHMKGESSDKAKDIADKLSKEYYNHGHAVTRKEAIELGLHILEDDPELNQILWNIYEDFKQEMEMNTPFDPLKILIASRGEDLKNITMLDQLPNNVPQSVAEHVMNLTMQQIKIVLTPPVPYKVTHAAIESAEAAYAFRSKGFINGFRLPNLDFRVSCTPESEEWEKTIEEVAAE